MPGSAFLGDDTPDYNWASPPAPGVEEAAGSALVPSTSQGLVRASRVRGIELANPNTAQQALVGEAIGITSRDAPAETKSLVQDTPLLTPACPACQPSRAIHPCGQQRRSPEAAASPSALPIHHYCSPCFSHVAERHRKARRSTRTRGLHAVAAPRCTPTGCASTPYSSTA